MFTSFRVGLVITALLILASCSSESVKRNTYQSLQIMKQRECTQTPGEDCPEPKSYNKYEKQREEDLKQ